MAHYTGRLKLFVTVLLAASLGLALFIVAPREPGDITGVPGTRWRVAQIEFQPPAEWSVLLNDGAGLPLLGESRTIMFGLSRAETGTEGSSSMLSLTVLRPGFAARAGGTLSEDEFADRLAREVGDAVPAAVPPGTPVAFHEVPKERIGERDWVVQRSVQGGPGAGMVVLSYQTIFDNRLVALQYQGRGHDSSAVEKTIAGFLQTFHFPPAP